MVGGRIVGGVGEMVAGKWRQLYLNNNKKKLKKKKPWYTYTIDYSAVKKKEILSFATAWMDPENVLLSEVSQSGKDKHHMIFTLCGI